jgi:hypothetical protein
MYLLAKINTMRTTVLIVIFALITIQCSNSDNIKNYNTILTTRNITEVTNKFFIAIDNNNWQDLGRILNDTVLWDYTSIFGGDPTNWTAIQIIDSWKSILPGYNKTHHQLGNFIVESDSINADVFIYVTATHYLENETQNNILTVVGSYEVDLKNINNSWRIIGLKFNLKYIDGNTDLPKMAQERVRT